MSSDLLTELLEGDRRRELLHNAVTAMRARRDACRRQLDDINAQVATLQAELRAAGIDPVDFGDFGRTTPISPAWGADRGRCIDRYYIEQFIEAWRADIQGIVLEVHDSDYTREFGSGVLRSDVVDIDGTNPRATVVADLRCADSIASDTYHCFIMTQTLHVIYDMRRVLAECVRILKPGGVLLATLACASRIAPEQGPDGDFWRFTASAARRLFGEFFDASRLDVRSHGNVLVTIAYLYGLACHELEPAELDACDPYFPLIVSVRAQKAPAA